MHVRPFVVVVTVASELSSPHACTECNFFSNHPSSCLATLPANKRPRRGFAMVFQSTGRSLRSPRSIIGETITFREAQTWRAADRPGANQRDLRRDRQTHSNAPNRPAIAEGLRPLEAGWKSWPASERGPVEPYKSVITPFEDFETQRGFLASSASELNFRLGSNCEELTQRTHVRVAPQ